MLWKPTRLRHVDPDALYVLSDLVKEKGLGERGPRGMKREELCFIRSLTVQGAEEQFIALRKCLPHAKCKVTSRYLPHGGRTVIVFERAAVKMLLKLAGLPAPSKCYDYVPKQFQWLEGAS